MRIQKCRKKVEKKRKRVFDIGMCGNAETFTDVGQSRRME